MTDALSVKDLTVRLGDRAVLSNLSITLEPGRVTCIVGPNGAGKSTLMRCLAGLRRPERGEVRLGAASLSTLTARRRAQRIGFLPQTPEVAWPIEAETLVSLGRIPLASGGGCGEDGREAVARAMALTRVQAFAHRTVDTLSGGERGRVLIARALAGEPEWLLADEPLTGLDPGHQFDSCELFRDLAHGQGRSVVVTLHDLPMALRIADRVIVLAEGKVLADGAPEQALAPDVLRTAYGIEARLMDGPGGATLELIGRHGR